MKYLLLLLRLTFQIFRILICSYGLKQLRGDQLLVAKSVEGINQLEGPCGGLVKPQALIEIGTRRKQPVDESSLPQSHCC